MTTDKIQFGSREIISHLEFIGRFPQISPPYVTDDQIRITAGEHKFLVKKDFFEMSGWKLGDKVLITMEKEN